MISSASNGKLPIYSFKMVPERLAIAKIPLYGSHIPKSSGIDLTGLLDSSSTSEAQNGTGELPI
jgi:hypothetical protein